MLIKINYKPNFEKGHTVHIGTYSCFFWYIFVYQLIISQSFDNNYYLMSIIDVSCANLIEEFEYLSKIDNFRLQVRF